MGKYGRYWEMKSPNVMAPGGKEEMFKCKGCGSETFHDDGWNGEPNTHICGPDCKMEHGDVRVGNTDAYRRGYERIFPNSPGSGF